MMENHEVRGTLLCRMREFDRDGLILCKLLGEVFSAGLMRKNNKAYKELGK